jgi:hypothetical protein
MAEDITKDGRLAVVEEILRSHSGVNLKASAREVASFIISALDQRAQNTKWEGPRKELLQSVEGLWIPHGDLLEQLNALPGATLTMGDLQAQMRNMGGLGTTFHNGETDQQADCLRVYLREKKAGTDFKAICDVISGEVCVPAWDKRDKQYQQENRERRQKVARSGKDFGFTAGIDGTTNRYSRHNGQLYRLIREAAHQFALFRVNDIGDDGVPTNPHVFSSAPAARDFINSLD